MAGQHPVEDDQVGQGVADEVPGLLGVPRAQHVMAGVLEVEGDQLLDRRLVFDDKDVGGHAGGFSMGSTWLICFDCMSLR